jgi:hypothetical protein
MHLEAIELEQKRVFQKLKSFSGFYLVGGTALALQIGHRISVDFDLFSNKEIPRNLIKKVKRVFEGFDIKVIINNPDQLAVKINNVKIDFVNYPFAPILGFISFQGINILKVPEIAAMKAHTLDRRPALKDYVDLYFILKEKHLDLKKIINLADKKYREEFNARLFLEQLIYLEDVRDAKINFLERAVSKKELQEFFEKEIKKIIIK